MVVGILTSEGRTTSAGHGDSGDAAVALDDRTIFEIGSITKVFTSLLLADVVAARRGRARAIRSRSICRAEVKVPERGGRQITPRGPGDAHVRAAADAGQLARRRTCESVRRLHRRQMYDFLARYQLTRDIGAAVRVLEPRGGAARPRAGAAGRAWTTRRWSNDADPRPLGMTDTGHRADARRCRSASRRGTRLAGSAVPNWDLPTLAGAGALRSNVNDMLVFARANLSDRPATCCHARCAVPGCGTPPGVRNVHRPRLARSLRGRDRCPLAQRRYREDTERGSGSTENGASRPSS